MEVVTRLRSVQRSVPERETVPSRPTGSTNFKILVYHQHISVLRLDMYVYLF